MEDKIYSNCDAKYTKNNMIAAIGEKLFSI
jgi:hypothetical protein